MSHSCILSKPWSLSSQTNIELGERRVAAVEKDKAALTEETRRLKVDLKKAQEEGQTREAQNQDSCEHPTNDKVTSFLE